MADGSKPFFDSGLSTNSTNLTDLMRKWEAEEHAIRLERERAKEKGVYEMRLPCGNCGKEGFHTIKKGIAWKEAGLLCPTCGVSLCRS